MAQAQVKVGDNPFTIDPNSLMEMESTDKGFLPPRISLVSTTDPSPMSSHVAGMMVYNIATVGDVSPGLYYNDGSSWIRTPIPQIDSAGIASLGYIAGPGYWIESGANLVNTTHNIGIGTASPLVKLQVDGGTSASMSPLSGYIVTNTPLSTNLVLDDDEIMARNNGVESVLHLQSQGGDLQVHANQANTELIFNDFGNLGIGLLSPTGKLHIHNPSGLSTTFRITNSTTGTSATDGFEIFHSSSFVRMQTRENGAMIFGTNATDRMIISSSGGVGIGLTSPAALLHLHNDAGASTAIRLTNNTTGVSASDGFEIFHTNSFVRMQTRENGAMILGTNSTDRMIISNTGEVGIGLTSPASLFHLHNSSGSTTSLQLTNNTTGTSSTDGFVITNSSSFARLKTLENGALFFGTNDTDRMTIASTGAIGVGITSPASLLHIHNDAGSSTVIRLTNNTTGTSSSDGFVINHSNSFARIKTVETGALILGTDDTDRVTIAASGAVGFGINNPVSLFHLHTDAGSSSVMRFTNNTTGTTTSDGMVVSLNGSVARIKTVETGAILFGTDDTDRMIISSSGAIGMGTTGPSAQLSVNGAANKPGGGSWAVFSDERLKKNMKPFDEGLDMILDIEPISFQYNGKAGIKDTKTTYIGVSAQQMRKVAPFMVQSRTYQELGSEEKEDFLEFDPSALDFLLINSIKELNKRIEVLENENKLLRKKLKSVR